MITRPVKYRPMLVDRDPWVGSDNKVHPVDRELWPTDPFTPFGLDML